MYNKAMKKCLLCFLLMIFVIISVESEALHIYVSPSGDNQNPGTQEHPVSSLTAARDLIRELRGQKTLNDAIYVEVMPGEFFMDKPLVLTTLDTGTMQSPVIFRGQSNAGTVFYGGMETDRFEIINPELWRVFIPEVAKNGIYFEQLYINGERRFRAQTPNRGEFNMVKQLEETILKSSDESIASNKIFLNEDGAKIITELASEETNDVVLSIYHKWLNTRKRIKQINIEDTALYMIGRNFFIDQNSRYFVENYRKALDTPGEWFLQRDGYLFYIPKKGETPENTRCIYPVNEQFILIKGDENKPVEYIRFENLSFQVASYQMPANGDEFIQAAAYIEATVMLDFANNIDFINCEIAHTGLHGIWFRKACSNSKVEHCRLYDLGGGAVYIGGFDKNRLSHHILVHNNILHHGGYVLPCAVGVIIFHGSDNEITHNEIADFRYSGVSAGWVWGYAYSPSKRNKIEFNHIHHLGWGELDDLGGVYTLGASEGTTVSNNVIHHVYSFQYGGWGLYTDEGTSGIHMENNLVYACKDAGFHQHYGKDNVIQNNIFAIIQKSAVQISSVEDHLSYIFMNNIIYQDKGDLIADTWGGDNGTRIRVNFDNNCYWKAGAPVFYGLSFEEWKKLGYDQHSIIADPLFVNPQQSDFHFESTSIINKIGFIPFDYNKAGVYGSEEWIKKAQMGAELEIEYDKRISRFENIK